VFANFDFLRERSGLARLATVPTLELDQRTAATSGGAHLGLAVRTLDLFPLANLMGDSGNYLAQPVQRETTPNWKRTD
jgi:hypothetical protein